MHDYVGFVVGSGTFEDIEKMDITRTNVLFRQDIVALKNYAVVKSNTYDSYDDSDMYFRRNGVEFMRFTTGGGIRFPQIVLPAGGEAKTWIYESIENTANIMRLWNRSTNTPIIAFGCDIDAIDANIMLVYETHVESRRERRCNTHNSIADPKLHSSEGAQRPGDPSALLAQTH